MTSRLKKLLSAVCCLTLFGFTQVGCQQGEAIQGSNDQKLLATTNLALQADYAHMRKLATANDGALKLDLADEIQYRFLRARVAASGKTPERYPQFFAMIEGMRKRHLAQKKGQEVSTLHEQPHDHLIGGFTVLPGGATFEATTFFTIQNGSDYSFVDVVVWDEIGTAQVSDYGWGEVYGDGRKLKARATGSLPFNSSDGVFYVDSVSVVSVGGVEETYYIAENVKTPPGGALYHPKDNNADGIVTICLDRNYGDCDYPMVGYRQVQIPLKGSITFPSAVAQILDTNKTYAKLVAENGGPREMAMGPFYYWLRINPNDRRQVTWDVPQNQGIFNGILFQRYEDVDLFLSFDVLLNRLNPQGKPTNATVKIASVASATSPGMPKAHKIQIVYSCLAAGTEIRLADGKTAKIEDITKGSRILTNDSGLTLGVADLSVGIERIPMVRIEDDSGHSLLLTTSHPVVTPDRGVVWAEELSVGNKVFTESGITTLVKAEREMFRGNVHNLKLDTTTLAEREFTKGSTMYANGFRVGDLAMQKAYEFKNSEDYRANVLSRLPAQWRADYQRSQKDGTLLTQR